MAAAHGGGQHVAQGADAEEDEERGQGPRQGADVAEVLHVLGERPRLGVEEVPEPLPDPCDALLERHPRREPHQHGLLPGGELACSRGQGPLDGPVDWEELGEVIEESYRLIAPKRLVSASATDRCEGRSECDPRHRRAGSRRRSRSRRRTSCTSRGRGQVRLGGGMESAARN